MLRGAIADRPWGAVLGAIATRELSGELAVVGEDGKRHGVSFSGGRVVAASSPLVADSVARVALTSHLVSSTQVQLIAKRVAAASDRDEVEVVAEAVQLSSEQIERLRHRLIHQRVARTFAIERGQFALDTTASSGGVWATPLDIGGAIYLGARMHLTEQRLGEDLRRFGTRFVLRGAGDPAALAARYGFDEELEPVLAALTEPVMLAELDARFRDIEPRTVQAAIYALVATGACEGQEPRGVAASAPAITMPPPMAQPQPAPSRVGTVDVPLPPAPAPARAKRPSLAAAMRAAPAPPASPTAYEASAPTGYEAPREEAPPRPTRETPWIRDQPATLPPTQRASSVTFQPPARPSLGSQPLPPRTRTISSAPLLPARVVLQVRQLIADGIGLLDQGADHFALLGVAQDATIDVLRAAYVRTAYQLHPDKLPPLPPQETQNAHRLFTRLNTAFAVLGDPVRRTDYITELEHRRSPVRGTRDLPANAVERALTVQERQKLASDAYDRGMAALRRDDMMTAVTELTQACSHAPADVDYLATLAWARFCLSSDKPGIAEDTRRMLKNAIVRSPDPVNARFFLGRVERMLGRVPQALYHFREVLELDPNHALAAAEVRVLEPRSARR